MILDESEEGARPRAIGKACSFATFAKVEVTEECIDRLLDYGVGIRF